MTTRKGMMVGSGRRGYYNIIGKDPMVHRNSAMGIKQPQRIPTFGGKTEKDFMNYDIYKRTIRKERLDDEERYVEGYDKIREDIFIIPRTQEEINAFEDYYASDCGNTDYGYIPSYKKLGTFEGEMIKEICKEYAVKSKKYLDANKGGKYVGQNSIIIMQDKESGLDFPFQLPPKTNPVTFANNLRKRYPKLSFKRSDSVFITTKGGKVSMSQLNNKAPSRKGLIDSGSALYTSDLSDVESRFKREFDEGYAQSYKISKVKSPDSVNKYQIKWLIRKNPYSFFWKRGNEKVLKDSSNRTAKQVLQAIRNSPVIPLSHYAQSSVKNNMYLGYVSEAIKIAKPKDAAQIMAKAEKRVRLKPYTNWSGD